MTFGRGCRQGDLRVVVLQTVGPVQDTQKEQYRYDEVDEGEDASVSLYSWPDNARRRLGGQGNDRRRRGGRHDRVG